MDPFLPLQQIDVSFFLTLQTWAAACFLAVFWVRHSHRENGIQLAFVVQGHLNKISYTQSTDLATTPCERFNITVSERDGVERGGHGERDWL